MRVEPRQRVRWITHEEATKRLAALSAHLALAAEFSLASGLQQANVLGLQWAQIGLERHMPGSMPIRPRPGAISPRH
jgi:hypothetical protein